MIVYTLERKQEIPRPRREVFEFFSEPYNLERITPAFLRFRIVTAPPIVMQAGTRLEYRLALFGVGFGWQTLIEAWNPQQSFVDVQVRGPYKLWRHTHTFTETAPGTTLMIDRVDYSLYGGALARLARAAFVAPMLNRIFDHRAREIERLLGLADGTRRYSPPVSDTASL